MVINIYGHDVLLMQANVTDVVLPRLTESDL